ncbi:HAMP domain-containing sensor histidine kinase [Demequina zhanjiangensis]|uniref:histidine kinase n=1 Tax=Demequina zhanjiangensis TaxID=3051659 RepID=A0ABT8G3T1_9MICO|nr:ATP-binding protein [Demequina sp. SYSU T00b26]MDN4473359.1 ATP-binding protein [Demequina sp. SYSU T00b26]
MSGTGPVPSARSPRGVGLVWLLMGAFGLVVLVVAVTAWLVAGSIGPQVFERNLMGEMRRHGGMGGVAAEQLQQAELAYRSSAGAAMGVALAVAALVAAAVSVVLARRMARSLGELSGAAHQVADGRFGARVGSPQMGREFDELADSFNQMSGRLEESEQLRQRMIGDVAHELRTPVATITGYLEALEDGVAELTPETVAMLRAQGARLTRLSEDLSAVSRAESGAASMALTRMAPGDLLRLAHLAARERASEAGVALELHASGDLSDVNVDPDRMAQVLGNLVDNALRHTPAGGTVSLIARAGQAGVELVVSDTGAGISPEHLPHVFERFYRADAARDRASGGSGVGLAIVRALVAAHGGTVSVDSAGVGRGATFVVTLPAAR